MSKIFDLINELCPNGVEFVELGEIADIVRGVTYDKNLEINGEHEQGIKILRANNINLDFTLNFEDLKQIKELPCNSSQKNLMQKDILICVASGSKEHVGKVAYCFEDTDCFAGGFMSIIRAKQVINARFLFFIMSSSTFKVYLEKVLTSSTINNLNNTILKNFKLPVPPMEVQREIVRILDSFTLLTAELTARKKQYEFYRDFLLSFDELDKNGGGCELKMLGEICELIRGNGLQKKDFVESGVPAIHYGQIYTYYGTFASKTKSFVSVDTARNLKKVNFGDVVITNTSENLQDVGKAVVYLGKEQAVTGGHATILKPKNTLLGKFFVYLSQTAYFYNEKVKYAKGTKVIDVSASDMSKILIPVPSLQTQQKVVDILDKFDTLVNSITEGLPREIELRRKQYEHYRELLLNFKPKMTA